MRVRRTPTPAGATLFLGLLSAVAACSGGFDGDPLPSDGAANQPGAGTTHSPADGGTGATTGGGSSKGSGGKAGSNQGSGGSSGSGSPKAVAGVVPVTRVARLSHPQYRNTVAELFGIEDDPTSSFTPDAIVGSAFDTTLGLTVDNRLGPEYRSTAEALAERAVGDDAIFARIVGCDAGDAACPDEYLASFGQKAFRRPLNATEKERFRALFDQGADLVASGDAFRDGVQVTVEAFLQAPQFLYRTELGNQVGSDELIALDSWEMASRLSYFAWNSMPDTALFASAEAGELAGTDGVTEAVERLAADPRATRVGVSFHSQAWDFQRFAKITPDSDTYPDAPSDMIARVRSASERFVEEVIDSGGGLEELLTAPYAFADSELAPLYGADVAGGLERIDFDGDERKGFLMQVGYLASHAYSIKTDPIHRGLFVVRNLLCRVVPDPPAGASETPLPETDEPIETTREEIELLTGQAPSCRGCHADINPPGFAFEGFDAVGSTRTRENDTAIDTSGTFELDGTLLDFEGASELVDALAQSSEARSCYASGWLSFAYGRDLVSEDDPAKTEVGVAGRGVREIMAAVALTKAFRKRAPNEVGP
ncbi:MAG TPA: DUF1592 domain-containing protein [Polyangiaceae bacterium]